MLCQAGFLNAEVQQQCIISRVAAVRTLSDPVRLLADLL